VKVSQRRSLLALQALVAVLAFATVALAQVNTATVFGTVVDPSGAAVPGATLKLTNNATGASWQVSSDASGQFAFTFIPPGTYELVVNASGFKEYRQTGITLTAGRELRLELKLELGALTETVTVAAEVPLINTVSAKQEETLETLRILELPTSNRDWSTLLSLAPGVKSTGSAVSMHGLPQDGFRFTIDGTASSGSGEYESMATHGYIKSVSLEAIREVSVSSGIAPAETGPTMTGNVNVITKSGTNEFHGSLFLNNSTENVSARYQFSASKTPMVFNQFGGSLGGPIVRNKAFFFVTYEGYRKRSFAYVAGNVPTKEFREMMIAAVPEYKAFFDTLPLPTRPYQPGAITGYFEGTSSRKEDGDHLSIRGDYNITSADRLTLRYTTQTPYEWVPRVSPVNSRTFDVKEHKGTLSFLHSAASWSSETRYGYSRYERDRLDGIYARGVAGIAGNLGFSNTGELMQNLGVNWNIEEVMALPRGRHLIKFGVLFHKYRSSRNNEEVPAYRYASVQDMLANRPAQIVFSFGVRPYSLINWINGYFIQDDIRLTPNLTLNLGLRYDYFSVPKEKSGRLFNRTGPFGIGPYVDPDEIWEPNYRNFSPRFGFAWTARPKLVIRGGFGKFTSAHNQFGGPVELVRDSLDLPNRVTFSQAEALALGIRYPMMNQDVLPLVKGGAGPDAGTAISRYFPEPYSLQWTLSVALQLKEHMAFESSYVGNHAVHANLVRKINQVDPVTGQRPYAGFSEFNYYDGSESVHYNAWYNTFRHRFSNGLQFNAVYTWVNTLSYTNAANIGYPNPVQNPNDIRSDRGPSPFDIRHHFHSDFLYELPLHQLAGNSGRRSARLLLRGWQISGIFKAETGSPINITQSTTHASTRPDYIGGDPYAPDPELTLQYLRPSVFAKLPIGKSGAPLHYGNLGRNALRGPGFWNIDLGLAKNFYITERTRLQVRCDMFNAFNHTNFSGISTDINSASFGRLTSTRGARTIQFNARLTF